MSMSDGIFIQFLKWEILIDVGQICILVEAEGVSSDGLGIIERTTTVLNI
jgi:hypothetical protein